MRGTSIDIVVLPAPVGPTRATIFPGSMVSDTPRRIQSDGSSDSVPEPSVSRDASDTVDGAGYRNHTSSNSTRPSGSTRSYAPGRSLMATGASSTSNTRSNDTNAVMMSMWALVSAVIGM